MSGFNLSCLFGSRRYFRKFSSVENYLVRIRFLSYAPGHSPPNPKVASRLNLRSIGVPTRWPVKVIIPVLTRLFPQFHEHYTVTLLCFFLKSIGAALIPEWKVIVFKVFDKFYCQSNIFNCILLQIVISQRPSEMLQIMYESVSDIL